VECGVSWYPDIGIGIGMFCMELGSGCSVDVNGMFCDMRWVVVQLVIVVVRLCR